MNNVHPQAVAELWNSLTADQRKYLAERSAELNRAEPIAKAIRDALTRHDGTGMLRVTYIDPDTTKGVRHE